MPEEDYHPITESIIDQVRTLLKEFYLELNPRKTRIIDLTVSNHVRITGINLVRDCNGFRKLTVGRKRKDELFYKAVDAFRQIDDRKEIQKIKGMQSFILSIEGQSYEETYSKNMKQIIQKLGFPSLKALIDSL